MVMRLARALDVPLRERNGLVALVRAGATFRNGKLVERPDEEAA
jgi:hypothetical protein